MRSGSSDSKRGSESIAIPDELLRSTQRIIEMEPQQLLRATVVATADSERG